MRSPVARGGGGDEARLRAGPAPLGSQVERPVVIEAARPLAWHDLVVGGLTPIGGH